MLDFYLNWLNQHQFHGIRPGLTRIVRLLKRLGNPHRKYPTLHVAGTNGKGSTCALLDALLAEHGLKTGLYTSPHLFKLNERFKINSRDISDEELAEALSILYKVSEEPVTYFELTTALAFRYFAEKKVDLAIIETGLGGRLDATNVILPEIAFITSIGLDHTKYLGPTLERIAFEKAGIIKRGKPLVLGRIEEKPLSVILERAKSLSAEVFLLNRDFKIEAESSLWNYQGSYHFSCLESALQGDYQGSNLAVAIKGLEILEDKGFLKVEEKKLREALRKVTWEGRYKRISLASKEVLFDCAHNIEGIKALKHSLLKENFSPFILVFGATNEDGEKPYLSLLEELLPLACRVIITEFKAERRVVSLQDWIQALGDREAFEFYQEPLTALKEALTLGGCPRILVTGSIYFVAEAMKALKELQDVL
jgi:dihydrofolate synthase/folylpolyglutamate synthase